MKFYIAGFGAFRTLLMKGEALLVVTPFLLLSIYRRFEETFCLPLFLV